MKTIRSLIALPAVVLAFLLLFNACMSSGHKIIRPAPAFAKYISGFTSGMISRRSTIRIELAQGLNERKLQAMAKSAAQKEPAAGTAAAGKNVDSAELAAATAAASRIDSLAAYEAMQLPDSALLKNAFSFEPEIKGRTVWVSDRVIEFIPSEPLSPNQFYNVDFHLKNVTDVDKGFEHFNFQVSTYEQQISMSVDGLESYDNYNVEWQKLTGTLSTTDYADTAAIRKVIGIMQDGKQLAVHISSNSGNTEFYYSVDSIRREEAAGTVTVRWSGAAIGSMSSGSEQVNVPALGDFTVTAAEVKDNGDQYVELTFSDPILYNQDLKGLITIQGMDALTYSIETNHVKVYPGNRIEGDRLLTVTTGVKNFKGYKMLASYTDRLVFEEPRPLVRLKGSGCILPNSNGLIFPFEAISLKAVDVRVMKIFGNNVHQFLQVNSLDEANGLRRVGKVIAEKKVPLDYDKKMNLKQWNTFVIDLGKLITPDPGAIYRVSIKFGKSYALCNCTPDPADSSATETAAGDDDNWNEADWSSYGYDYDDDYYSWDNYNDDHYTPCDNDYYSGKAVSRNILASDLGMIYKLDDNKMSHAFISNMITAKPMTGVTVEYYDYVKQLIAQGVTNANGMLDVQMKRKPFLMIAKYGRQRGYLKLLDANANSLSKFDIEGEVVQKGVKGFIYGERGVWRPGDSLYLSFIMEDKEKRLPPDHPVKFQLQDPNGQVVYQVTKTKNMNGMYDFRTATSAEAPTGNYTATAKVGNRVFTQSIKIETVKPNRLKISLDVDPQKTGDTTARLSVKWLHGAVAKNLHAMISVSISQSKTRFPKYSGYEFDSPVRSYSSNSETVFDGNVDENGNAVLRTALSVGHTAPGMLRATYITKVFEEGGDFSVDRYTVPYSPFKTYVGLHVPEATNEDNTLVTGNDYRFDVVTLNEKGEPVTTGKLQVKIYKIRWRWWYEKGEEDLAGYISRAGTIEMKDTLISAPNGKGYFRFHVAYPDYGRYLVTVTDPAGGHQTGKVVLIDWPYWSRGNRSSGENAGMLNFACNKERYTTGEKIRLSFPSPSDGMALVSVETGTRVVKKMWIATKRGETTYEFPAAADMSPNAYIHVTLIQPHASTKNDLPIRMYGLVPVTVDDPQTHLNPEIEMPDVLRPGSAAVIKVKEKSGRRMTYTLAIVDEGLLDLTRFKTPDPRSTFYAREALGVKTWDMYDDVIGAFAGKLDKLLSIGGDGDGLSGKGLKANRFKPVVRFIGPFTLAAGREQTHSVPIPDYAGAVRVMVVAEDNGAYGNVEKTVAVRKPLMILATLPRVLGPGETVALPVDVFAMEKQVKDVKVSVEVNNMLSISGSSQQAMHFDATGDDVLNFRLNAAAKTGIAKVKITAVSGKEKATQEIELDVRAPNPKVTDGTDVVLEPGRSWSGVISYKGIEGTNKATVEFSTIPPMGLERRLDYLIRYPHGCIEQTTSSVFPQLYVSSLTEMTEAQKSRIQQYVKAGIRRLQLFQTAEGGFSYWPGESGSSEWGSNYAGHFMIEAEKLGYSLPGNLKSRWLKYEQERARNWFSASGYTYDHGRESDQNTQAYRLFVLALGNSPEPGAMNRLREERDLSAVAKWRLAAAYRLAGQTEAAAQLVAGLPVAVTPYKELSYSYGSDTRDEAMILEMLTLLGDKARALPLAKEIAKALDGEAWMSTQETAYCLLAICEYTGAKGDNTEMDYSYSLNGGGHKTVISKKTITQLHYTESDFAKSGTLSFTNTGRSTLFVKVMTEGIPLTGDKTAGAAGLGMQVTYKDMKGREIRPDKLEQGTDFIAEVKLTNPGTRGLLKEMALSQIFPGGWEIHNARMDGTAENTAVRYQDIRDDRVYSYYDLPPGTSKTVTIRLNATYLGRYYLPAVYSEAMYDHTVNARVPGKWVEVVP